ncbi:methionyl-tRNA formyltransferase [Rhodohalobacter sp. SW132]|nr:methionyl-tRNA formyltransferase [Rhodohalobacter sp. SW132]
MGSPDFAVPSLEALHKSSHNILTVVSGSDKRRRRRGDPEPTAVKKRAQELGLPTLDADDMKSEKLADDLRTLKPDLFVVVAFKILPKRLLEIPAIGSINLHASLLPAYRGAAPIHWAVINGEKETGCTVFFLDQQVDTGEILKQSRVVISENDTTGDVYNKLMQNGADLIVQSANLIAEGEFETYAQDHSKATPAPKLFKENTRIDFAKPAQEIHNLIRGLNPFPVAWCTYKGKKMNVYQSAIDQEAGLKQGELKFEDEKLLAGTGDGSIELKEVQLPGGKRISGAEFGRGFETNIILNES